MLARLMPSYGDNVALVIVGTCSLVPPVTLICWLSLHCRGLVELFFRSLATHAHHQQLSGNHHQYARQGACAAHPFLDLHEYRAAQTLHQSPNRMKHGGWACVHMDGDCNGNPTRGRRRALCLYFIGENNIARESEIELMYETDWFVLRWGELMAIAAYQDDCDGPLSDGEVYDEIAYVSPNERCDNDWVRGVHFDCQEVLNLCHNCSSFGPPNRVVLNLKSRLPSWKVLSHGRRRPFH